MELDDLYLMNPWWRFSGEILRDRYIQNFESSRFKFYPEGFFENIDLFESGIYTVRGPRQVGKTTFLKLFAKKLLIDEKIKPTNVFYLTCDMIRDKNELAEILKIYFQTFGGEGEFHYILLDELTLVENWQHAVKYLSDLGFFDNSLLILTGSSAYDMKSSSERMPGRRGKGKDLVYLTVTFSDYLETLGYRVERIEIEDILSLTEGELKSLLLKNSFAKEQFSIYMITGGFPKVIDEFLKRRNISGETRLSYKDFVLGDAEKYLSSRRRVIEILKKLPDITGQRFSWNSLLDHFSGTFESVETVQKYFEYFGYSFILSIVFYIDISKGTIRWKKQKKVYPFDQIIADVVSDISKKEISLSKRIEMIVLRHLLEESNLVSFGLNLYQGPFYWYSDRGNEIDFVMERGGKFIPVEVKYQNRISKFDYIGMKRIFRRGILVTKKDAFKDEDIIALPAWLFLSTVEI